MAKPVTLRGGRERGASVASRDLTLPEWHARTPAIHAHANRSCTFRHSKHSRDVRLTSTPAVRFGAARLRHQRYADGECLLWRHNETGSIVCSFQYEVASSWPDMGESWYGAGTRLQT